MTDLLKIEPHSEDERRRLARVLEGARPARRVTVRCARGCKLATIAATAEGPVFVSEPWPHLVPLGVQAEENGRVLSRRETVHRLLTDGDTGQALDGKELHSSLAFIGTDAEPVDLLTVCKHGGTVIDAAQARAWLADGRAPRLSTSRPVPEYEALRPGMGTRETTTITTTLQGDAMPIDGMRDWLGW